MAEGTNNTTGLMHSYESPIGVGLVFCRAKVLDTEVLVDSVSTDLEELVCSLLLQSPDSTDLPELEPLESLGLLVHGTLGTCSLMDTELEIGGCQSGCLN